jgi:hypothetical protein
VYKSKKHIGFYGPVLLIPRKLFLEHEVYESVKNSVIEDFNLGKFYNKKNIIIEGLQHLLWVKAYYSFS